MGEKRFIVIEEGVEREDTVIEDTITKERYNEYGVVDLLNEQSDIIEGLILDRNRQEEKLDIARRNMTKQLEKIEELQKENEQLRKELKNRSAFIVDKGLGDTFTRWKYE